MQNRLAQVSCTWLNAFFMEMNSSNFQTSENFVFNLDKNIYKIKNTSCRNIQKCIYVLVLLDNTSKVILVFAAAASEPEASEQGRSS